MEMNLKFSKNTIQAINIYPRAARDESKTEGAQVKVTATQKKALQAICSEQGKGVSTLIGEALEIYIEMLPVLSTFKKLLANKEKVKRHKQILIKLLDSLS